MAFDVGNVLTLFVLLALFHPKNVTDLISLLITFMLAIIIGDKLSEYFGSE
jgi:hypothetical protein